MRKWVATVVFASEYFHPNKLFPRLWNDSSEFYSRIIKHLFRLKHPLEGLSEIVGLGKHSFVWNQFICADCLFHSQTHVDNWASGERGEGRRGGRRWGAVAVLIPFSWAQPWLFCLFHPRGKHQKLISPFSCAVKSAVIYHTQIYLHRFSLLVIRHSLSLTLLVCSAN